jgi:hypothetical protein
VALCSKTLANKISMCNSWLDLWYLESKNLYFVIMPMKLSFFRRADENMTCNKCCRVAIEASNNISFTCLKGTVVSVYEYWTCDCSL